MCLSVFEYLGVLEPTFVYVFMCVCVCVCVPLLTQEAEHVHVERGLGGGVEQEAVAVGPRLVSAVGRDYEQRREPVLQLLTHLCDGLAVAATAVVHRLTYTHKQTNKQTNKQTEHTVTNNTAHSGQDGTIADIACVGFGFRAVAC